MKKIILRKWLVGLLTLTAVSIVRGADLTSSFRNIAKAFGNDLANDFSRTSKLAEFKAGIAGTKGLKIEKFNGRDEVENIAALMGEMLEKKVNATAKLVNKAEEAYQNFSARHPKPSRLEFDKTTEYYNAKKLLQNESQPIPETKKGYKYMKLSPLPHFNFVEVNTTESTVHVPTNVFDRSADVLAGVSWTENLNKVFIENYKEDPTLTWQYFGGANGYFRLYPGIQWQYNNVDTFDCRRRRWYIQAASSPKGIVIMVDVSGSVKGLHLKIALETASRILDTLSDDDFFNVVLFNTTLHFLDPCFDDRLIQANGDNKKRIKSLLKEPYVVAQNMANWPDALAGAFKLLQTAEEELPLGEKYCNKALMIITDGPPDHYQEIFTKYNRPIKARVFTYLIGQAASNAREAKWMACFNKGYFTKISTLADIEENIQIYTHVLSRPLVLMDKHDTIWTSVYFDAAGINERSLEHGLTAYMAHPDQDIEGLRMMTSVAQPVFDPDSVSASHNAKKEGRLLGVMGIDVPIKQITKLAPDYLLGVNGYSFGITNNGYILFHPDFRPTKDGKEKPNYNSVDLTEVELMAGYKNEYGYPNYNISLRSNMIKGLTGQLTMSTYIHFDNMTRVVARNHTYFYTSIKETPFSLGISYPMDYGHEYRISAHFSRSEFTTAEQRKVFPAVKGDDYRILISHDWEGYCNLNYNDTLLEPIDVLVKYLLDETLFNHCSDEVGKGLVGSILWDAVATKNALEYWNLGKADAVANGVLLVFMGSRAGVTRYYRFHPDGDTEWVKENDKTIQELYYKRAIDNSYANAKVKSESKEIITYMVPRRRPKGNMTLTTITAVSPLFVTQGPQELPFAVFGVEMRFDQFEKKFREKNSICREDGKDIKCPLNCLDEDGYDCYLLDENGFIIFSKKPEQLGKFLGEVDGLLLGDLVVKEVYRRVEMYDYQAVCNIYDSKYSSAFSFTKNPLQRIFNSFSWMVSEIALMLLQFNLFSWWTGTSQVYSSSTENTGYGVPPEGASVIGETHCLISNKLFDSRGMKLSPSDTDIIDQVNGTLTYTKVLKTWYANRVVKTNLIFLVVDGVCADCEIQKVSLTPEEVQVTNQTIECQELRRPVQRRVPKECHDSHPAEDYENHCAVDDASPILASKLLFPVLLLILVTNLV